ncbi:MAG TPA: YebC/PmpR family DNA-binding transcriptional regulator, partial [Ktedonobacterales bacterium]|nr:YebC/PmpR family DNA-binding transcriptional regulator [Ktedonobacterales bacterium]
ELSLELIDAGAEDVEPYAENDETLTVYTAPKEVDDVRVAIEGKKLTVTRAEVSLVPKTTVQLDDKDSSQAIRLIEKLEDLDDVQNVYTNAEFSAAALAAE